MGYIYVKKGYYDKAIECYQKAINKNLADAYLADAYYSIGYIYILKDNMDKSIEYCKIAARLGNKKAQNILSKVGISW